MNLILDYDFLEEKFSYLDELNESGSINMFGAADPLATRFRIGKATARIVFTLWMRTFNEDKDVTDRVAEALEINNND